MATEFKLNIIEAGNFITESPVREKPDIKKEISSLPEEVKDHETETEILSECIADSTRLTDYQQTDDTDEKSDKLPDINENSGKSVN